MSGATRTYEMESEIRGYHVCASSWRPQISGLLLTDWEVSNEHDEFALAFYQELGVNEKKIVGHLPVEFSRIAAYYWERWWNFLQSNCKKEAL